MTDLRIAAQQALEALQEYQSNGAPFLACDGAVAALKAALAQQDEPQTLNDAMQQPLAIERLRDALVASRIIPPTAVEDPDEYDDGVTLYRIEALHRRLT